MYLEQKKFFIIFSVFLLLFLSPVKGNSCDMVALLAKEGHHISEWMQSVPDTLGLMYDIYQGPYGDYTEPYDFFVFLGKYSRPTRDDEGYGFVFYENDEILIPEDNSQSNYLIGQPSYYKVHPDTAPHPWQSPFHQMYDRVRDQNTHASIMLGHVRNASSALTVGNHPFWFQLDENGDNIHDRTFVFQHNGDCTPLKDEIIAYLLERDPQWFEKHPLNWRQLYEDPDEIDPQVIIDSELLFHLVMSHVIDRDGDIISGIVSAMNQDIQDTTQLRGASPVLNFILSDGDGLYVYRNSRVLGSSHNLEYRVFDSGFVGVKTRDFSDRYYADVDQYSLLYIPRNDEKLDGLPANTDGTITFPSITGGFYFEGTLDTNTVWQNGDYYITGDLEIPAGVELDIRSNARVFFIRDYNLTINGQVRLNGGQLNLAHGVQVVLDGAGAELFLNWGASINGLHPESQIIARNGAVITTPRDYSEFVPPIRIFSEKDDVVWRGIKIENPDNDCWFTNCDISDIQELCLKHEQSRRLIVNRSWFHDAGSIIVKDGAILEVKGSHFYNNFQTPLIAYESPLYLKQAEGEWNYIYDNDGNGVSINYMTSQPSSIKNTIIHHNQGHGCQINGQIVHIDESEIHQNALNGIFALGHTASVHLTRTRIEDNGAAEYVGRTLSYHLRNGRNIIRDESYGGESLPLDQYLLMAIDGGNIERDPIDVRGNDISRMDTTRFYPSYHYFDFGSHQEDEPDEARLLRIAIKEINQQNYELAKHILEKIINNSPYTSSAVRAVKYLYQFASIDGDYSELRDYLQTVPVKNQTAMAGIKMEIMVHSLMKEGDYNTALSQLSEVMASPIGKNDLLEASFNQKYCQLRLSESERNHDIQISQEKGMIDLHFAESKEERIVKIPIIDDLQLTNYPNPFNPITQIDFSLPVSSDVRLVVYNMQGQRIKTLLKRTLDAGDHHITWNGKNEMDQEVETGVYLLQLTTDHQTVFHKMLLIK